MQMQSDLMVEIKLEPTSEYSTISGETSGFYEDVSNCPSTVPFTDK